MPSKIFFKHYILGPLWKATRFICHLDRRPQWIAENLLLINAGNTRVTVCSKAVSFSISNRLNISIFNEMNIYYLTSVKLNFLIRYCGFGILQNSQQQYFNILCKSQSWMGVLMIMWAVNCGFWENDLWVCLEYLCVKTCCLRAKT